MHNEHLAPQSSTLPNPHIPDINVYSIWFLFFVFRITSHYLNVVVLFGPFGFESLHFSLPAARHDVVVRGHRQVAVGTHTHTQNKEKKRNHFRWWCVWRWRVFCCSYLPPSPIAAMTKRIKLYFVISRCGRLFWCAHARPLHYYLFSFNSAQYLLLSLLFSTTKWGKSSNNNNNHNVDNSIIALATGPCQRDHMHTLNATRQLFIRR